MRHPDEDFAVRLKDRLAGARVLAVVGVGDEEHPQDRLGMEAARQIRGLGLRNLHVFLGGTVPEAFGGPIRRLCPDHILLLDAADMGAPPGSVAIVEPGSVQGRTYSTHGVPLTLFMDYLRSTVGVPVTLVGLQPQVAPTGGPNLVAHPGVGKLVAALAGSFGP